MRQGYSKKNGLERRASPKQKTKKMARVGKIQSILAANVTGIATPDNANFVFVYFESDTAKLCVKNSAGVTVKSVALT